jgi:hypothetical protein
MKQGVLLAAVAAALLTGCSVVFGAPTEACPVTTPQPAFVPPPRYPAKPFPTTQAWYGSAALWIALDRDGERWHALPRSATGAFGQKTFWWSEAFSVSAEPEPAISVEGRRLDRAGPTFRAGDPGTNASFDGTTAMLVGVDVPTSGCWELTGRYRGAELSYVVWIAAD